MKNKKQKNLRGLSTEEREVLEREWGGYPVVESQKELRLFVSKEDIVKATRKDFGCCALAEACKRSIGSHGVFFYKKLAYVHIPTSGNVQRFQLSAKAQKFISDFDKGLEVESQEIVLLPPTYSNRLSIKTKYDEAAKKRRDEGNVKPRAPKLIGSKKGGKKVRPIINSVVRSGRGQVHFTTGRASGKAVK